MFENLSYYKKYLRKVVKWLIIACFIKRVAKNIMECFEISRVLSIKKNQQKN